mmetsp:Transcript_6486/g.15937  ORF Transcript_6486/g.15937 Transcript_6486/m.15937 type:complete len:164 (+) Transcript_6486:120-611(+)
MARPASSSSESDALLPQWRDGGSSAPSGGRKMKTVALRLAAGLLVGFGLALAILGVCQSSGHPLQREREAASSSSPLGLGWGRGQPILPLYARRPSTGDNGDNGAAGAGTPSPLHGGERPARNQSIPTSSQAKSLQDEQPLPGPEAAEAHAPSAGKWRVTFLG